MKIGQLRKRVTIQTFLEVKDGYGQKLPLWVDGGTYWASIKNLSGREVVNAKQVKADTTHMIRLRHVGTLFPAGGVLPTMRVLFGARVFSLLWVDNVDERNREYQLLAQEVPAAP